MLYTLHQQRMGWNVDGFRDVFGHRGGNYRRSYVTEVVVVPNHVRSHRREGAKQTDDFMSNPCSALVHDGRYRVQYNSAVQAVLTIEQSSSGTLLHVFVTISTMTNSILISGNPTTPHKRNASIETTILVCVTRRPPRPLERTIPHRLIHHKILLCCSACTTKNGAWPSQPVGTTTTVQHYKLILLRTTAFARSVVSRHETITPADKLRI